MSDFDPTTPEAKAAIKAAIDEALKSEVRAKSRSETVELVKMFEGRIFHTVFEAAHDVSLS